VNIVGVSKTVGETSSDSFVKWSIGVVQAEKISVTRRSFNILKEQRNYVWLVDRDGKILNVEDPKCANHHMRGIAYTLCNLAPIKRRHERRRQEGMAVHKERQRVNIGI
jgi:phage terminase large subunit